MDDKVKHLEMILGIINRMAHCSFLLKGWTVILVSGLLALAAKEENQFVALLACLPAIAFWVLDGYYLYQERLYRQLYCAVRKKTEYQSGFGMDATPYKGKGGATWGKSSLSKTMVLFHGILILTSIISLLLLC